MAPAPSLKELSKVICNELSSASLPLVPSISQPIEAFTQHLLEEPDESLAERLQEELLSIYQRLVHDEPRRYAPFIAILRLLRPVLPGEARMKQWWDCLIEPVFQHSQHDKSLAAEAAGIVLETLTDDRYDSEPPPAVTTATTTATTTTTATATSEVAVQTHHPLADRVLTLWVREYEIAKAEHLGQVTVEEKRIRQLLLLYGKKKPRDFLHAINGFFVKSACRGRILALLCEFIEIHPPHLHRIHQTPLFVNLLRCLHIDTSSTVINLALTAIIMLLPHMPSSLVPHLPALFNIYGRLMFWEREQTPEVVLVPADAAEPGDGAHSPEPSRPWEQCAASELDRDDITHLHSYFTMLYGLYPLNFMEYIRKPRKYLRYTTASSQDARGIEVQSVELSQKLEPFRQKHLLHPNFFTLTLESERTDFSRWLKCEPPEVLADCMELYQPHAHNKAPDPLAAGFDGHLPFDDTAATPTYSGSAILRSSSPFDSPSSPARVPGSSAGLIRPQPEISRQMSQNSVRSPRLSVLRHGSQSALHSCANLVDARVKDSGPESPPRLVTNLETQKSNDLATPVDLGSNTPKVEQTPRSMVDLVMKHVDSNVRVAQLRRQIMLLRNDLVLERYLKQQHMTHIGQLRKRHIMRMATEAETQNLLESNRLYKKRWEEAKQAEVQVKKEADRSRVLAKKWEADLQSKLKALREEQRKWTVERGELERALTKAMEERDALQRMVSESEEKHLKAQQDIASGDLMMGELAQLRATVERLNTLLHDHETKGVHADSALQDAKEAETRAEKLRLTVLALEKEVEQTRQAYEVRVHELNKQISDLNANQQKRADVSVSTMVDSGLAASRATQTELQRQLEALSKRNLVLQSKYLDLKLQTGSSKPNVPPSSSHGGSGLGGGFGSFGASRSFEAVTSDAASERSVSSTIRTRFHRGLSDSDLVEGIAYNVTPPLDALPTSSVTSPGYGGSSPGGLSALSSPTGTVVSPGSTTSGTGSGGNTSASGADTRPHYASVGLGGGTGTLSRGISNSLSIGKRDKKSKQKDDDGSVAEKKGTIGIRGIRRFVG